MRRTLLCGLSLVFAVVAGCDDGTTSTASGSTGANMSSSSGMGGTGSTSNASSSTGIATSTTSGDSSSSSGTPAVAGAPGGELVNGGDVMTSPGYKMIMTFGQPSQNQGTQTSSGYKMRGGLIGATN
ncbi:MAG: hypothetical protein U0414_32190 [Polyangiaceae bacterium]